MVAGNDSETALTIPFDTLDWKWPTAEQIAPGAIDPLELDHINIGGVGCRKYERCVRKCSRCCASASLFGVKKWDEVKCSFGEGQYRYGIVSYGALGYPGCDLFPAGVYIRDTKGNLYGPQPVELKCRATSAPKCGNSTVERCTPSDWDLDGNPNHRGVWDR